MSENKVIAEIENHSTELIKIQVNRWNGSAYIDVRIFYRKSPSDGEAWHPTKKGIRIHEELLGDLISGLEKAQEAIEEG